MSLLALHYHFHVQTHRADARTLIMNTFLAPFSCDAAHVAHKHRSMHILATYAAPPCLPHTMPCVTRRVRIAPTRRRRSATTTAAARAARRRHATSAPRRMEPRERLGRSPLRLLLVAGRAAQQAQPSHVEEASCAHGHHQQHAHQSPVHWQQQPTCRGTLRFRSRPRECAAAGQRWGSARTQSCRSHAN